MLSNEVTVAIIGGMFTVLVTSVGWGFRILFLIRTDAKEINDAVNHRHRHGEDTPRLFDIALDNHDRIRDIQPRVTELHEWKKGYDGSGLSNAERVNELINRVEHVEGQISCMSVDSDERSIARNKFFDGLDEPNSRSDTEEEIGGVQ